MHLRAYVRQRVRKERSPANLINFLNKALTSNRVGHPPYAIHAHPFCKEPKNCASDLGQPIFITGISSPLAFLGHTRSHCTHTHTHASGYVHHTAVRAYVKREMKTGDGCCSLSHCSRANKRIVRRMPFIHSSGRARARCDDKKRIRILGFCTHTRILSRLIRTAQDVLTHLRSKNAIIT